MIGGNLQPTRDDMNKAKFFGLLEVAGFYSILVSLIAFLFSNSLIFVYLAIISWTISFVSHIIESKLEKQPTKKILTGV